MISRLFHSCFVLAISHYPGGVYFLIPSEREYICITHREFPTYSPPFPFPLALRPSLAEWGTGFHSR